MKGQVIWITGASTGIGQSCALEAAKLGAKLVLSARNEVLLQEVKEKCLGKTKLSTTLVNFTALAFTILLLAKIADAGRHQGLTQRDVLVLPMDLTQFDTHQKSVKKVLDHFGKVRKSP